MRAEGRNDWKYYQSGILSSGKEITKLDDKPVIDHAVVVVGFTPNYWIVKNSWSMVLQKKKNFPYFLFLSSFYIELGRKRVCSNKNGKSI